MSRSDESLLPPGRAGIEARVERAGVLLDELELISKSFLADQQLLIVESQEGDRRVGVYTGKTGFAPAEFSIRAGEIVHNLRSSLDHLVWQLVSISGQKPNRGNAYPIGKDAQGYDNIKQTQLRGVPQAAREIIGCNQPWSAPGSGSNLWSLCCMSNEDKHRHLPMVVVIPSGLRDRELPRPHEPAAPSSKGEIFIGPLTEGREVYRFTDFPADYHPRIRLSLDFVGDGPPRQPDGARVHSHVDRPVIDVLRGCLQDVEEAVHALSPFL